MKFIYSIFLAAGFLAMGSMTSSTRYAMVPSSEVHELRTAATHDVDAYAPVRPWKETREIWFDQPPVNWKDGLPVGNGRLGAMIAGTFPKERG